MYFVLVNFSAFFDYVPGFNNPKLRVIGALLLCKYLDYTKFRIIEARNVVN